MPSTFGSDRGGYSGGSEIQCVSVIHVTASIRIFHDMGKEIIQIVKCQFTL